ncbi:MAG: hypothetical protein AAGG69_16080 [Pseudomonadota bacterium]
MVTVTDGLVIEGSWQRFANTAIEPNNGQGLIGVDNVFDEAYERVFEALLNPGQTSKLPRLGSLERNLPEAADAVTNATYQGPL